MSIRPETPADIDAIRAINVAAFAHHPYSRQTEHLVVEALREAGALAVSLVEETEGRVVGHIVFSRASIGPGGGRDLGWFLLGPLAVLPALQRRGIGSGLVRAGLDALRRKNATGCVLVGDSAYYARFGFRRAASLVYPGVPPEFVLCLPLAGPEPVGEVRHHKAFEAGLPDK